MSAKYRVHLRRSGDDQVLVIPPELEMPGSEAIMSRDGDRLIIEATPKKSLMDVLGALKPLDIEFPDIPDAPPEPFKF